MRQLNVEVRITMTIPLPDVPDSHEDRKRAAASAVRQAIVRYGVPSTWAEHARSGWGRTGLLNLGVHEVVDGTWGLTK